MIYKKNSFIDLGAFSDDEKELLNSEIKHYRTEMSKIMKEATQASKLRKCYFCGKDTNGFCNSHSVPRFCLENISSDGEVVSFNSLIDNPLLKKVKGINNSGTFHIICRDCDSKIFSDYETPDNYLSLPTHKMLAQISLKNSLFSISKRLFEIELFNIMQSKNPAFIGLFQEKNYINNLDLQQFIFEFNKAKKALEKDSTNEYYICYYEKLDYVVPLAFQNSLALICDFDGNIINNIYDPSPQYIVKDINLCVFPLKDSSVILMFIDDGDKRYRSFYKHFRKLTLEDKLSTLTFIMFAYSEDIFFSKTIEKEISSCQEICKTARLGPDFLKDSTDISAIDEAKRVFDLNLRSKIPNLLSSQYKIR